nr:MAG TPA: hypothetical protein [Caudoviricetes sp.]
MRSYGIVAQFSTHARTRTPSNSSLLTPNETQRRCIHASILPHFFKRHRAKGRLPAGCPQPFVSCSIRPGRSGR